MATWDDNSADELTGPASPVLGSSRLTQNIIIPAEGQLERNAPEDTVNTSGDIGRDSSTFQENVGSSKLVLSPAVTAVQGTSRRTPHLSSASEKETQGRGRQKEEANIFTLVQPAGPRPNLSQLDPTLFPDGPQLGEVVEVTGTRDCGKSLLSLRLVVTALLPHTWRGAVLGGCHTGVIFFDCDKHFSILHLENMLQKKVKHCLKLSKEALKRKKLSQVVDGDLVSDARELKLLLSSGKVSVKQDIRALVKQCLKSFHYLHCKDSTCFAVSLQCLDIYMKDMSVSDVSLVVVDSLSAFSLYDLVYRAGTWDSLGKYYDSLLQQFLHHIKKYGFVLVCTTIPLTNSEGKKGATGKGKGLYRKSEEKYNKNLEDAYLDKGVLEEERDNVEEEQEDEGDTAYLGRVWSSNVSCKVVLAEEREWLSGSHQSHQSRVSNERQSQVHYKAEEGVLGVNVQRKNRLTHEVSVAESCTESNLSSKKNLEADTISKEEKVVHVCVNQLGHNRTIIDGHDGRQRYSAVIVRNGKVNKKMFAIHEDGLRWFR